MVTDAICRGGTWSTERFSDLPQVTELGKWQRCDLIPVGVRERASFVPWVLGNYAVPDPLGCGPHAISKGDMSWARKTKDWGCPLHVTLGMNSHGALPLPKHSNSTGGALLLAAPSQATASSRELKPGCLWKERTWAERWLVPFHAKWAQSQPLLEGLSHLPFSLTQQDKEAGSLGNFSLPLNTESCSREMRACTFMLGWTLKGQPALF